MDSQEYKVSVYYSRMPFPLTPWVHCYVVTKFQDTINRYEVFHPLTINDHPGQYKGSIYKNVFRQRDGMKYYPTLKLDSLHRFIGKEYSTITGVVESQAHKLYQFINNGGLMKYPCAHKYDMIWGPNSNSFIQWVIDQVPDNGLHLPHSAWGKKYKHD